MYDSSCRLSKGNQVNIPEPGCGYFSGNATEIGDVGEGPEKSSLFFLTVRNPGIRLSGDRVSWLVKHFAFEVFGALSTTHENPME